MARTEFGSQYPGLYLFLAPARLMRPVRNLASNTVEMIGTFEQCYLNICVTPSEAHEGVSWVGRGLERVGEGKGVSEGMLRGSERVGRGKG